MVFCACIAAALLVFVFIQLLGVLVGRSRRQVLARLENLHPQPPQELEDKLKAPLSQRVFLPGLQRAGAYLTRLTPAGVLENIQRSLVRAGSPGKLGPSGFLGLQGILGLLGLGIGLFLGPFAGRSVPGAGLVGLALGLLVPYIYLGRARGKRQRAVRRSLPDFLDLLAISVEAGLGFDAALVRVVDKQGGVLGEEFTRALQEMRMGKARRHALRDLARRVGVDNLTTFVSAIIQAEQLGVSIGSVLRIQSQALRTKRRQWAEEAAMKAPIKMLFPLVFFILPTLFVVLLGPAVIQIMGTLLGP